MIGGQKQALRERYAGEVDLEGGVKTEEKVEVPEKASRQRQRRRKPGEEPIQFIADTQVLDSIANFFGLEADFSIRQQLVTRSGVKDERGPKKIYFVTSGGRLSPTSRLLHRHIANS